MLGKIRLIGPVALFLAIVWPAVVNAQGIGEEPVDAPSGLTATSVEDTIVLNWTAANNPGVVEQRVYRLETRSNAPWDKESGTDLAGLPAAATTYTDSTVEHGKKYSYQIGTRYPAGTIEEMVSETTRRIGIGNLPPRDLAASVVLGGATNEVRLSWVPGTNPFYVRQYVQRRAGGKSGTWVNVADLAANATSWTDRNVVLGEKYVYAIRGEKANARGSRSEKAKVSVVPTEKTPLQRESLTVSIVDGSIVLNWTPGTNINYVRQVVLRKPDGKEAWVREAELARYITTWTDTSAMSGEQYFYRIKAENVNGKGPITRRVGVVAP